MMDALDCLYKQSADFKSQNDGTFWILSDDTGKAFAFDDLVYGVWSAFDGALTDQVIATIVTDKVSAAFVESTTKVLARAGAIVPSQSLPPMVHTPPVDLSDPSSFPLISVIIPAGRQARVHLEACLPSVLAQTYPNLEIILVDNQTTDDSVSFTRQNFPQIKIIPTDKSLGFGAANNLAMKQARGEFFFLLNDDTIMEPDCIAECAMAMFGSDMIAAVVPKMKLSYMRSFFNSMGNSMYPDGRSCDNFIGYLDVGQFDDTARVFGACFGAAMLRRSVVEQIGDIDEEYFYYYEDIDWSFRARIGGYDIVTAPQAIVYHKFNATTDTLPSTFKLGLVIRNRLRFIWKNLDLGRASRFMRVYLKEDFYRLTWARDNNMPDVMKTCYKSWRQWLCSLPKLAVARWKTRRLRHAPFSDDAAFALANRIPQPAMHGRYPVISAPVIQNHYMRLEMFAPDSAPAPEDLGSVAAPIDIVTPPLWHKVRHVLREKGSVGLIKETGRYLRWWLANLQ
ncbi:MAG: glycosyltransferase [Chloroflexi bacterium]|nr:glycosyltransferase [Chloroflexota bacterium]